MSADNNNYYTGVKIIIFNGFFFSFRMAIYSNTYCHGNGNIKPVNSTCRRENKKNTVCSIDDF